MSAISIIIVIALGGGLAFSIEALIKERCPWWARIIWAFLSGCAVISALWVLANYEKIV